MILSKYNINFLLYLSFLLPLVGTSIPPYLIVISFLFIYALKFKFKVEDVFYISLIFVWFLLKIYQSNLVVTVILFRYYFGFILFYLFFNNFNIYINFNKLLFIICIAILIEAFLINTILSVQYLPNYPKSEVGDFAAKTEILGFYQRPYSIGTNSTVTSTIVMALVFYIFGFSGKLSYSLQNKLFYFSVFSVIILGSGTGYVFLLLFFIFKINPFGSFQKVIFSLIFILIIYYLIFILDIGSLQGLEKISAFYLMFLYDFKIFQINDVYDLLSEDRLQIFIGKIFYNPQELIVWSDFAWLNLFESTGYIGLLTTIVIFLFKTNKYNFIPVLVLLLGSFHYGAIYSLPGQLLIGYFLSKNFINFEKLKYELS